ncbi:MAG TPA: SCP2 sterol-binding domain-containing protein [Candidatus Micrarchaeia archaeon]|nr:SCP2 sterol-binding domain-containing protein [Candidatus Micrarchaeia archaeon]
MADDTELTPAAIMARAPEYFQADRAKGITAVCQWDLAGDRGGQWHLDIADGALAVVEGVAEHPTVTFAMSDDTFVRLLTGRMDGTAAFMTGKLKVKGDMGMALRLQSLFRSPHR